VKRDRKPVGNARDQRVGKGNACDLQKEGIRMWFAGRCRWELARLFLGLRYSITQKNSLMPNPKTDASGYSTSNADEERDMGAKGGPTTSLGQPDDKHGVSKPYDADLQAQIAAKGKNKKDKNKKDQPDKPNNRSSL